MEFVFDDGGRSAAGYKGKTGDCVARAIAIATNKPYQEVYETLAKGTASERITKYKGHSGKKTAGHGIHTNRKWFDKYMDSIGWKWIPTMQIGSGCKVHLKDGELPMGRIIVSVSKHMLAVIDGVIHDTFEDQRNGTRCVYGYYQKVSDWLRVI